MRGVIDRFESGENRERDGKKSIRGDKKVMRGKLVL